jgi:hypothetical protein
MWIGRACVPPSSLPHSITSITSSQPFMSHSSDPFPTTSTHNPSKLHLKSTPADTLTRRERKHQRRVDKERRRLLRANGFDPDDIDIADGGRTGHTGSRSRSQPRAREWTEADDRGFGRTPPRRSREESMTPPRKRQRRSSSLEYEKDRLETSHGTQRPPPPPPSTDPDVILDEDYDESALPPSMLDFLSRRRKQKEAAEEMLFRQKLFDLMSDEEGPYPITSGRYPSPTPPPPVRIPDRYKGSELPNLDTMDDEEYTESIRLGIWKMKNADEWARQERLSRLRAEEDARREKERTEREKEEKRRIEILERERGKVDEKRAKRDRDDYVDGWLEIKKRLSGEVGKGFRFKDVPWPVYKDAGMVFGIGMFTTERIRAFLESLSSHAAVNATTATTTETTTTTDERGNYRRVIRDAVLRYHPDRFERVVGVVSEKDKEMVRAGGGVISRVLNEINSAL